MEKIAVDRREKVWVLALRRPEVHNCIDGQTAESIASTIKEFAADESARVLVVTGSGEASFCTGADLRNLPTLREHRFFDEAGPLGFARLDPGKPTIAAVNGYCFAGGLELAVWCDFRIASENASFGGLNRRWGIPFIDGGTQRLPRLVGAGAAAYLIETGVRISARRAFELGLVEEVVPQGRALDRARELAEHMASYPFRSLQADRQSLIEAVGMPLAEGLDAEFRRGAATLDDEEAARALEGFGNSSTHHPQL